MWYAFAMDVLALGYIYAKEVYKKQKLYIIPRRYILKGKLCVSNSWDWIAKILFAYLTTQAKARPFLIKTNGREKKRSFLCGSPLRSHLLLPIHNNWKASLQRPIRNVLKWLTNLLSEFHKVAELLLDTCVWSLATTRSCGKLPVYHRLEVYEKKLPYFPYSLLFRKEMSALHASNMCEIQVSVGRWLKSVSRCWYVLKQFDER